MNETEKVTQWVENKIGKLLSEDIEKQVSSEESLFDVENYSQSIFVSFFENESENHILYSDISPDVLKLNLDSDDFYLTDGFSQDSSEEDHFDLQKPFLDNILVDLQSSSESTKSKALQWLDMCSAEELVIQPSWPIFKKILQDMIKTPSSEKLATHVLELYRVFLMSNDVPKVVCESFISLTESITFCIDAINFGRYKMKAEAYDFKSDKWFYKNYYSNNEDVRGRKDELNTAVILKSMWLLVQCQRGIPAKWNRFNEKRLREIVFSFIQMLASTNEIKNKNVLSGLEVLSVLDPKARWCSNWCHGATGRLLLCSALKTHRKLINEIVDFVIVTIKNKESALAKLEERENFTLPPLNESQRKFAEGLNEKINPVEKLRNKKEKNSARLSVKNHTTSKGSHSAPSFPADENSYGNKIKSPRISKDVEWINKGISKEVVNEAKFCHCMSMVVYLIQYRRGRTFFPAEVSSRRRRITVSDFVSTITSYINSALFNATRGFQITDDYKQHMIKLIEILKSI